MPDAPTIRVCRCCGLPHACRLTDEQIDVMSRVERLCWYAHEDECSDEDAWDIVVRLRAENERYREALVSVANRLDYLRNLWGDEGVTRRIADAVKAALNGED